MRSLYVFMIACILPAITGNAKADILGTGLQMETGSLLIAETNSGSEP